MAKYKDNKIDVMESDADIAIDERRASVISMTRASTIMTGTRTTVTAMTASTKKTATTAAKTLLLPVRFLRKRIQARLYHMEHLDCMECAAKMEGKIREMPSVFFASISFTKKELRVISKENPDNLIPQLLSVCRTVDENIGIVPPSDKGDFKTEIYEIPTLDCAACAVKLEKLVNHQPGVLSARSPSPPRR